MEMTAGMFWLWTHPLNQSMLQGKDTSHLAVAVTPVRCAAGTVGRRNILVGDKEWDGVRAARPAVISHKAVTVVMCIYRGDSLPGSSCVGRCHSDLNWWRFLHEGETLDQEFCCPQYCIITKQTGVTLHSSPNEKVQRERHREGRKGRLTEQFNNAWQHYYSQEG